MNFDRDARIFVTGGTGFVGRSLLRWRKDPANGITKLPMTLLSRDPGKFQAQYPTLCEGLEFIQGDISEFKFPTGRFSHVLHGATETTMAAAAEPEKLTKAIVQGTKRVLQFATECGARRLCLVSSGAVYGPQPSDLEQVPETFDGEPDKNDSAAAYGRAKRIAERHAAEWGSGGRICTVARLFAFVGPDLPLDTHFAIGNFIRDALAGKDIEVRGDGTPVRSYLEASDLAEWLMTVMTRGSTGRAYNVGSDEAIDMAGLAALVAETVHPSSKVHVAQARPDYAGRKRYVPSVERAKTELSLQVRVPLADAIRRTAAFHRG